ncbi:CBS domain-containing protein [Pseudonocardia sp. CA-107938]|uniref:CBS domain-containing protein n=1 Tax=Pseudonocardia sp. CA-107938 TaxID=3240021 RepID=UPI003D903956
MRIADVLKGKGSDVATVSPSTTVAELLALLAEHNIGAVPVVDGDTVVGIVSERDIVRRLHTDSTGLLETVTSEIMSTHVTTCAPEDRVADLAKVMTERRFRHLPVVVDGRLVGIVSIGDLVKARIDLLESETEQLQSYIAG